MTHRVTLFILALMTIVMTGCSSPEAWVLVSVRDGLSRSPVQQPVLNVGTRSALLTEPGDPQKVTANDFGVARMQIAAGQVRYRVVVDADGYDLHTFDLPALDAFFPSGQWLDAEKGRAYPLRPGNHLELMVTLEP